MLPTIVLYIGRDRDVTLVGPGSTSFDANDYASTRLVCAALGISKSSLVTAELETAAAGANLLIHFLAADTSSKTRGIYEYRVESLTAGGKTFDDGDLGAIHLLSAS